MNFCNLLKIGEASPSAATTPSTRPVTASIFDRLAPKASPSPLALDTKTSPSFGGVRNILDSSGSVQETALGFGSRPSGLFGQGTTTSSTTATALSSSTGLLGSRTPVKSSLFKNLVTPPWDQPKAAAASETSPVTAEQQLAKPLTASATATPDKAVITPVFTNWFNQSTNQS